MAQDGLDPPSVKKLLTAVDNQGNLMLHRAVFQGDLQNTVLLVAEMVKRGLDLNVRGYDRRTALGWAIRLAFENSAALNQARLAGRAGAAMPPGEAELLETRLQTALEIVQALVGAKVEVRQEHAWSIVQIAVDAERPDIARMLLNPNVNISADTLRRAEEEIRRRLDA
jgi:ankyrin repeat protein